MMTLSNVLTVEISIRMLTTYWSIAPNQVVSVIANLRVERPASTYSESKLWILRSRLTGKFNKWAKLRWAVFFKFYSAVWSGPTCSHVLSQNNFRQGLVSKRKTHLLCFLSAFCVLACHYSLPCSLLTDIAEYYHPIFCLIPMSSSF